VRWTAFDRSYGAGIARAEDGPASNLAVQTAMIGAEVPGGRVARGATPRIAPTNAFALGGCVLTLDRVVKRGYVVFGDDGLIAAVSTKAPQGVLVHETDGVILPGLIDPHGHPEFNIFAAWEPPSLFINRRQWRGSDLYQQLIRGGPWNKLQVAKLDAAATR
jgi:hypothetical protein